MCLIIHAPAGVKLPAQYVREAWDANPDGAGFAWTDAKGKVHHKKGFMNVTSLLAALKKAPTTSADFTLHFRWATHGKKDKANTHPWVLEKHGIAVIHNGIISGLPDHPEISDTGMYTATCIDRLARQGILELALERGLIAKDIGLSNKLVIHRPGKAPFIVNAAAGSWHGGVWYSNEYWGGPFDWQFSRGCYNSTWNGWRPETAAAPAAGSERVTKDERDEAAWLYNLFQDVKDGDVWDVLDRSELRDLQDYASEHRRFLPDLTPEEADKCVEEIDWLVYMAEMEGKPLPDDDDEEATLEIETPSGSVSVPPANA